MLVKPQTSPLQRGKGVENGGPPIFKPRGVSMGQEPGHDLRVDSGSGTHP